MSLSVTDPYNQEFVDEAAQKEMSDKFAPTDSLTVDAGNPLEYGVVYDVGDIVTVYDREKSAQLNSVISAVTVKRTATEHTVKLTLGESKPKLLDGYAKKTDLLAKNQRAYPAAQTSTAGTLTTYDILSDSSVKFNGITYTVEKNAAGLISKISDSNGNEFSPTVAEGAEITDIAFHNAVFAAIAIHSGLGAKKRQPKYLYRNGDQCSAVTGGWEIYVRPNTYYEAEFREDCIYQKSNGWQGSINYNYIFAQTSKSINLSGYSRLCIICNTSTGAGYPELKPVFRAVDIKVTSGTTFPLTWGGEETLIASNGSKKKFILDIGSLSGNYYIHVMAAEYNTVYTYEVWVE